MNIHYIPNMVAHDVCCAEIPAEGSQLDRPANKDAFTKRNTDPNTTDCFISMFSGVNPAARIKKADNPAAYMHGVVADYDTPLTEEKRMKMLSKLPHRPAWISTTFSGGTRAVWVFEKPLPLLAEPGYIDALLRAVSRGLHLKNAFGSLDEGAFYNPSQYYHIGWNLQDGGGHPIDDTQTLLWQEKAFGKTNWSCVGTEVSLERVEHEVKTRFPGRWKGPFKVGARGVRFWDPLADNPTAAVVKPTGMLCYTGGMPFMPWSAIFGPEFCEQSEADGRGKALKDVYVANDRYWFREPKEEGDEHSSCWLPRGRSNALSLLESRYGLKNGGKYRECQKVLGEILNLHSVQGAAPFLYDEREVVKINGMKYLNISVAQAMKPADCTPAWREGFPWIADFLSSLLGVVQLPYFLSWLSRAYKGALAHQPKCGQALFIAGRACNGKNLLSEAIIGPLLGGFKEVSDYLKGENRYNAEQFKFAVWTVNDATPLQDARTHKHFSAMVKSVVANRWFQSEAKFCDQVQLPWNGRLVVTCNDDPESLRILPRLDISNKDKLIFLHTLSDKLEEEEPVLKITPELPYFAAYLKAYQIPKECEGDARFGVKSYLHPEMLRAAEGTGAAGVFQEILDLFLQDHFAGVDKPDEWQGSAMELFSAMARNTKVQPMLEGAVSSTNISTLLGNLKNHPMEKTPRCQNRRAWRVERSKFEAYQAAA